MSDLSWPEAIVYIVLVIGFFIYLYKIMKLL